MATELFNFLDDFLPESQPTWQDDALDCIENKRPAQPNTKNNGVALYTEELKKPRRKAESPTSKSPEKSQSTEPKRKSPEKSQSTEPKRKSPEKSQSTEPKRKSPEDGTRHLEEKRPKVCLVFTISYLQ